MPLEPKSRLGGFEILDTLGAGGMGEVYLARDTHLKREVAIKVLPDDLARDPQRVARFEREAVLLASLSHPNIGTLHGLERDGDVLFLVLDLVKGLTLAEKMQQGPLPLREALDLFRQIAAGLGAAHERGIIHRDLKPANVKVTPQGLVKVLDFGLAKELLAETPLGPSGKTVTAPDRMTMEGDILGTLAYMSPEQARGQSLDKRTDIWSFGVCFFEALSGRHPFEGKTSSDILAAVISTEPDFGALPAWVPRNIRHLLQRCLRKELHRRLHDIEDARLEIEEALEGPLEPPKHEMPIWAALALAAAGLLVGFVVGRVWDGQVRSLKSGRVFTIDVPPTEPVALEAGSPLALSPDGTRLVYTARRGETTELRLRAMDRLDPTPLPGTTGASSPFFSPDGDSLGFFSEGKLQRMSLSGFAVESLVDAPSPRGANWGSSMIVLAPLTMGGLSAMGTGNPAMVGLTTLGDETRSHRWPTVLPDGHVLFTSLMPGGRFRIEVVASGETETRVVVEDGSYARYSPRGHLVFARGTSLMAARFDSRALEIRGAAIEMLSGVGFDDLTGASFYDLASDGTLVYVPEGGDGANEASGRLLLIDRNGGASLLTRTSRGYQVPRLSPSGDQLLVTVTEGESTDIFLLDTHRGSMRRVTFEGNSGGAIWKPDGREMTFGRESDGIVNLFTKAIDGSSPAVRLTTSPNPQFPNSWSPDGRHLAFTELSPDTQFDVVLWVNGRTEPFLATPFNESAAMFSPDGRYLAYVSDENGIRDEIYVREFPSGELKGSGPISTEGGHEPVWGRDGEELFYRDEDSMMVVSIETEPEFRAGKPRPLFEAPFDEAGAPYAGYDKTRDGTGFIMVQTDRGSEATRLHVVVDWFSELERRVPPSS
ncbi:MAG TPA: protein kinase [Vicinamibacteria bacterium]|nr:protein kinase [Vicinamibacteria bacterium]